MIDNQIDFNSAVSAVSSQQSAVSSQQSAVSSQQSAVRLEWIDFLRALALLLVIYGHLIPSETDFFVLTSAIKLPLFFAITGYVSNYNKLPSVFYKKLIYSIVLPWLLLSLFPVVILSMYKGQEYFVDRLLSVILGNDGTWYIPAFIVAQSISYCVFHFCSYLNLQNIFVVLIGIIGFSCVQHDVFNIFMINRGMIAVIYVWLGRVWKRHGCYSSLRVFIDLSIYLVLLYASYKYFPGLCMDVHMNSYYNIPLCLFLIFFGIDFCFQVASHYNLSNRIFSFIGKNSLLFYLWNGYAVKTASYIKFHDSNNYINAIPQLFICLLVLTICSSIYNRLLVSIQRL